ncbi:MAG: YdcF family protein [Patescibacteria group bacterium]|nr:YdcF family protein [Patescibacteria group bacterium]
MKISERQKISIAVLVVGMFLVLTDVQLGNISKLEETNTPGVKYDIAMVLGASVQGDEPSDALEDRLEVGIKAYKNGEVQKILITGDDGNFRRDEISVMHDFLTEQGVSENDILVDPKGYRTYESCKNVKAEYPGKKILVITQRFHIGRALFLCNRLGADAYGRTADLSTYEKIYRFWGRDLLASYKAWWDVYIIKPESPAK